MRYPVAKVFITQQWGVNQSRYARFGFKGHNGIDLRVYDKDGNKAQNGELIAPHDGVIKEAGLDADGYGYYYKIENDKEGSILGHNKELFFKVGDSVKEGQVIGVTNNTGWSTASHVHWGYYLIPRNRNNGYGGTINQVPLIKEKDMADDAPRLSRDHYWKVLDKIAAHLSLKIDEEKDVDLIPILVKNLIVNVSRLETEISNHKHPIVPESKSTDQIETGSKVRKDKNGEILWSEKTYKPAK